MKKVAFLITLFMAVVSTGSAQSTQKHPTAKPVETSEVNEAHQLRKKLEQKQLNADQILVIDSTKNTAKAAKKSACKRRRKHS